MTKTISIIKAYAVINAIAKGVIISHDRCLLVEHGGHIELSDDWARKILYKMKEDKEPMVRRMCNTASLPVAPALLAENKLAFKYVK